MELSGRSLGKAVLRQLEAGAQMAAAEALREVCGNDRTTLGWHCCIQQVGEQGLARVRRRAEQQDQGHSEKGIRTKRRGVSPFENPYVYAQRDIKCPTLLREDPVFLRPKRILF